ncbi:MAG: phosphatase PAP2 family protein [Spirochaetes bacterium]|nr:phosphatase PAP2 family protein [Spirochaetota bacterium]
MELEIIKFFLNLKDSCIFNIFAVITGKTYIFITVLMFAAYAVYRLKKQAIIFILVLIISVSASDVICYRILKPAIGRLRPSVELRLLKQENLNNFSREFSKKDFSMPSNHASNVFAFFIVYFIYVRRYWIPVLINSLLIAVSRVVVGKHYPTDILAGMITGIIIGLFFICLFCLLQSLVRRKKTEPV